MIINAVLYNNEYELLKFRLRFYEGVVDRVVILTSDVTFAGHPKPPADSNFAFHGIPLEIIQLDKSELSFRDYTERWPVEFASRMQLLDHVASMYSDAIIIHSDADEFPSLEQINRLRSLKCFTFGSIPLKTHYRRGNWTSLGINKVCSAVSCFKSEIWLNGEIRVTRGRYVGGTQILGELGSHFSYLDMDSKQVTSKLAAFSHSEFDFGTKIFASLIPLSDFYAVDHLGRARELSFGLLKIEKFRHFNSVQIAALQFNSKWFQLFHPRRNIISRVAASVHITEAIQNPFSSSSFPNSILRQSFIILDFLWRRVKRKFIKSINGMKSNES